VLPVALLGELWFIGAVLGAVELLGVVVDCELLFGVVLSGVAEVLPGVAALGLDDEGAVELGLDWLVELGLDWVDASGEVVAGDVAGDVEVSGVVVEGDELAGLEVVELWPGVLVEVDGLPVELLPCVPALCATAHEAQAKSTKVKTNGRVRVMVCLSLRLDCRRGGCAEANFRSAGYGWASSCDAGSRAEGYAERGTLQRAPVGCARRHSAAGPYARLQLGILYTLPQSPLTSAVLAGGGRVQSQERIGILAAEVSQGCGGGDRGTFDRPALDG